MDSGSKPEIPCTVIYNRTSPLSRETFVEDVHLPNVCQLSNFLNEVYASMEKDKYPTAETCDISDAVKEMVTSLMSIVTSAEPLFSVKHLHSVGSYFEGTKLGTPNEFDFVVEINCARVVGSEMFELKNECKNPGAVHVILNQPELLPNSKFEFKRHTGDRGDRSYLSPVAFRIHFWSYVNAAARTLVAQNKTIEKPSGKLDLFQDVAGGLDLYNAGPNIEVAMRWSPKDKKDILGISVDITPSISMISDIPETCQVASHTIIKVEGNSAPVRLIPTVSHECKSAELKDMDDKLCWRLSFSTVETKLVRHAHPVHKRCLQILKYMKTKHDSDPVEELGLGHLTKNGLNGTLVKLYHSLNDMNLLTTYMLKMAVLHHDINCRLPVKEIGSCMTVLLEYIVFSIDAQFLPNVFIPGKNAWSRRKRAGGLLQDRCVKPHLCEMLRLFHQIKITNNYDFDELFGQFSSIQKSLVESDGA